MKAELLKVGKDENCEVLLRDAGGLFMSMNLVGPGAISVVVSKKRKKKQ